MTFPAAPAPFSAKPAEYWNDSTLRLIVGSFDDTYAAKSKKIANIPNKYVTAVQRDLITLGYLKAGADDGNFGPGMDRAIRRFQRHAKRSFRFANNIRMDGVPWVGTVTGICDASTGREIQSWVTKKQRLPVGVYSLVDIDGGMLRNDVAKLWQTAIDDVKKKGGTLLPAAGTKHKYSDTIRHAKNGFKHTGGNSKRSLHYTGRAIDLSMDPAGGKGQIWWTIKEDVGSETFWRLLCKTEQQDGSQGTKVEAKSKKYYELYHNEGLRNMPAGYYMDLTDELSSHGFDRIPSQAGWESTPKKQEWWHFHYAVDLQETFLDEMELIGVTEDVLKKAGWTEEDMDKKPG